VELSGIADPIQPSEQDIHADGTINLTDIGSVVAAGKSTTQLEKEIEAKYVPAWYPHITVTVTPTARYFYVQGEVVNSGRILYVGHMTVMRAIGAAGHFTPFAGKSNIQITRADGKTIEHVNGNQAIKHPEKDLPVYPGDSIFVPKRMF
jgi:polysaccharide export outer membrane protein